jgi:hypothetical protein
MHQHDQKRDALRAANAVRTARATLKDHIHADPSWRDLIALVEGTAGGELRELARRAKVEDMPVGDLLTAAPGIRYVKASGFLATVDPVLRGRSTITLSRLGPSRRNRLAVVLELAREGRNDSYLERIASTPRNSSRPDLRRAA